LDFKTFKEVLVKFNIGIMDHILEGHSFDMGSKLSSIRIVRRKRDPRNPRVDWGTSYKMRDEIIKSGGTPYNSETGEGEKWLAYWTDELYFKFYWNKEQCFVKNRTVYSFTATRGKKGNKEKLINLVKNDDLAYLRFKEHGNL